MQNVIELVATRTPAGAVNIRTDSRPSGWPALKPADPASGWGTVTARYTFTVPTGSAGRRFELVFQAWTVGIPTPLNLKFIIDATAPSPPPTYPTPPPTYPTPPTVPTAPKVPRIEASPANLDFGEIAAGTVAERELTIKNAGETDLWIGAVIFKGGAKSPFDLCGKTWTAYPLSPGKTISLTICFALKATGVFKDQVIIQSNDPAKLIVTIPVEGKVAKKKSTISCDVTVRAKPDGKVSHHEAGRETEVLVTVTLLPARSADYTVKITDPSGRELGPFSCRTDANGRDKKVIPVWAGGVTGDIAGVWKVEVSWKGDLEYQGASSQCEFTVGKLASYEGTEAGPSTTSPTRPPNGIEITYNGFCSDNCSKIVFIQVVTNTAVFVDGTRQTFKPSDLRPDWTDKDNDAVTVMGKQYYVDYLRNENDPYYNGDDRKATRSELTQDLDGGAQGKHDTSTAYASMYDGPYTNAFDRIKGIYGKEVKAIVFEFEAFAFCVDGRDKGKFYQGIGWRYERENGEAGNGRSTIVGVVFEPSPGFKEALDKWCKNHGFTLPK